MARPVPLWNGGGAAARLVSPAGAAVTRVAYGTTVTERPIPGTAAANQPTATGPPPGSRPPSSRTCDRMCRTGKACGDSCISRLKPCRVGRGCACNGGDDEAYIRDWLSADGPDQLVRSMDMTEMRFCRAQ